MGIVKNTTLQLIRDFEKLYLKAYPDGRGFSIGYGAQTYQNGAKVGANDVISKTQAELLLTHHVQIAANAVNRLVVSNLTQNQFDALVSFTYNVGAGAFANSTLLRVVNQNANNVDAIVLEFRKYVLSNGQRLPGLVERRNAESLIYGQSTFVKKTNWTAVGLGGVASYLIYKYAKKKKLF